MTKAIADVNQNMGDVAAASEGINAASDQLKDTAVQSAQLAEEIAGQVNQFKIESIGLRIHSGVATSLPLHILYCTLLPPNVITMDANTI